MPNDLMDYVGKAAFYLGVIVLAGIFTSWLSKLGAWTVTGLTIPWGGYTIGFATAVGALAAGLAIETLKKQFAK